MTPSIVWPTQAKLDWLAALLRERLHPQITLSASDSCVALRVSGLKGAILIKTFTAFAQRDPGGCAQWDYDGGAWTGALPSRLPAPGMEQSETPLITTTTEGWRIDYDVLGLTWWMLARREEIDAAHHDAFDRFPASESHAFRHGYLERPIVDEWLHILRLVIARTWPDLRLSAPKFSMKVSHDVDAPSRYGFRSLAGLIRTMAGDILKRHDVISALQGPWIRARTNETLHPADPLNTFDWLMDTSEQHGLKSAFYFLSGKTSPYHDADYDLEHPAILDLMRRIHARGHEIGLHPSYNTFRSSDLLEAEATRLRNVAVREGIQQAEWGGRMHFLRWEQPTTMCSWAEAGMSYDSTLSYADRPGFRCGTCFEYQGFDAKSDRTVNLRIRPLIAMECTVMAARYMGLGCGKEALDKFCQLKDSCRAVGGSFTLLWHNSELDSPSKRGLYVNILTH